MKEKYLRIFMKDCVVVGDDIFYVASECNLIFKHNIIDNKIDIIGSVPENLCIEKDIIGAICIYGDELYIAPHKLKRIWIYSFTEKEWSSIERKEIACSGFKGMLQAFVYNGMIYMIGAHYPAIIVINPNTKEIWYIEKPFIEKGDFQKIGDIYFRAQHVVDGNYLFLPSCFDNTVLKFNCTNAQYEWISLGSKENCFSGITYDGKYYWLSPRYNSNIVRWDGEKIVNEIMLPNSFVPKVCYFCGVLNRANGIIVCNMHSNESLYIDKETLRVSTFNTRYTLIKELQGVSVTQKSNGSINVYKGEESIFEGIIEIDRKEIYTCFRDLAQGAFDESINFESEMRSVDGYIDYVIGDVQ